MRGFLRAATAILAATGSGDTYRDFRDHSKPSFEKPQTPQQKESALKAAERKRLRRQHRNLRNQKDTNWLKFLEATQEASDQYWDKVCDEDMKREDCGREVDLGKDD